MWISRVGKLNARTYGIISPVLLRIQVAFSIFFCGPRTLFLFPTNRYAGIQDSDCGASGLVFRLKSSSIPGIAAKLFNLEPVKECQWPSLLGLLLGRLAVRIFHCAAPALVPLRVLVCPRFCWKNLRLGLSASTTSTSGLAPRRPRGIEFGLGKSTRSRRNCQLLANASAIYAYSSCFILLLTLVYCVFDAVLHCVQSDLSNF